ncbi:hypothetical protein GF351_03905 [Candidatus Woesearchaeota archaeon]|nr:hypothetical protein [Candidatus Woesearchaeota archaeon]
MMRKNNQDEAHSMKKVSMRNSIVFLVAVITLLAAVNIASASVPLGQNMKIYKSDGTEANSGNVTILISDVEDCNGSIYNTTFEDELSKGVFSRTIDVNLTYGETYYQCVDYNYNNIAGPFRIFGQGPIGSEDLDNNTFTFYNDTTVSLDLTVEGNQTMAAGTIKFNDAYNDILLTFPDYTGSNKWYAFGYDDAVVQNTGLYFDENGEIGLDVSGTEQWSVSTSGAVQATASIKADGGFQSKASTFLTYHTDDYTTTGFTIRDDSGTMLLRNHINNSDTVFYVKKSDVDTEVMRLKGDTSHVDISYLDTDYVYGDNLLTFNVGTGAATVTFDDVAYTGIPGASTFNFGGNDKATLITNEGITFAHGTADVNGALDVFSFRGTGTLTSTTSGLNNATKRQNYMTIMPYIEQSGTAGYTALNLNVTEFSTGSGKNYLADWKVNGSRKFSVDSEGNVNLSGTIKKNTGCTVPFQTFNGERGGNWAINQYVAYGNGDAANRMVACGDGYVSEIGVFCLTAGDQGLKSAYVSLNGSTALGHECNVSIPGDNALGNTTVCEPNSVRVTEGTDMGCRMYETVATAPDSCTCWFNVIYE